MKRTIPVELLRDKLAESLTAPVGDLTRRDLHLPTIAGKAFAVIGVRRGGKTSFLPAPLEWRAAARWLLESDHASSVPERA